VAFDVADAVDPGRYPVAVLGEVLRGLGMGGVNVVSSGGVNREANCTAAKIAAKSSQVASAEGAMRGREREFVWSVIGK